MRKSFFSVVVTVTLAAFVAGAGASEDPATVCCASGGRAALLALQVQASAEAMVWIPAAEFTMGADDSEAWNVEKPAHRVYVDAFWIDATEITNAQFAAFVKTTGYRTVAERPVDWETLKEQLPPGTPKPSEESLRPGSLVFVQPSEPVGVDDHTKWWRWTVGADWRHPEGPESSIRTRLDHPVVQVAWEDAAAYCEWAGKRLPTEAEWERAARGGRDGASFVWGNDPASDQDPQANIWQGAFPIQNTKADGFVTTAPVKSYPPNGFGLFDMAGNVWEWCSDWYRVDEYVRRCGGGVVNNPRGPDRSFNPNHPYEKQRVLRGGSYLCHRSYCTAYRPSARRGGAVDTGMSHIGFRCARSVQAGAKAAEARD